MMLSMLSFTVCVLLYLQYGHFSFVLCGKVERKATS